MPNPHPNWNGLKPHQFKPGESGFEGRRWGGPPLKLPPSNRTPRTVTEAKDAALRLLDDSLCAFEKVAREDGVTDDMIGTILKLLGGFNASLPKPNEKPARPLEDMSAEELRAFIAGKK